jgi:hypothetical protein
VWLLPLLLTACAHLPFHKAPPKPVQAYSPPVSESPLPTIAQVELPPSALIIPSVPLLSTASVMPAEKLKRPKAHPKPPANPQQATTSEIPAVSAIGQLSSGTASDLQRETTDSIAATDRGLNEIDRNLNAPQQKTAVQIREFLKQAREALASGDLDGAHTLAAKAKVLLSELTP